MVGKAGLARRAVVVGALLALSTWLGAAPISAQDSAGAENGVADEPLGVAAPGLTVTTVSGEAFGGEAEISLTAREVESFALDARASLDALRTGGVAALQELLASAGVAAIGPVVLDVSDEEGPEPEVELPAAGGGPIEASEDELTLDLGPEGTVTVTENLHVVTEGWPGDTGWSRSEARARDVDGATFFPTDDNEDSKVETECSADLSGVEASTDIEDASYVVFNPDGSEDVREVPEHPDPNEELVERDFVIPGSLPGDSITHIKQSIVVNEQDHDENSITVTGVVEEVLLEAFDPSDLTTPFFEEHFEMRIAESHCDIHADPVVQVVEPSFTG